MPPPRVSRTRDIIAPRLGVGGRNTDKPTWTLRPDELADGSQDAIIYEGALRRRKGAKLSSTPSTSGRKPEFAWRGDFSTAGRRVTYYGEYATESVSGTIRGVWSVYDGTTAVPGNVVQSNFAQAPLPRAVYKDRLLLCFQDGFQDAALLSGSPFIAAGTTGTPNFLAGTAVIQSTTITNMYPGGFFVLNTGIAGVVPPFVYYRVLNSNGTTDITVEEARASAVPGAPTTVGGSVYGFTYPCVNIESTGTVTTAAGAATGTGTRFLSAQGAYTYSGLLVFDTTIRHYATGAATTETNIALTGGAVNTNVTYALTARCPFKDACVHNEVLYGVGTKAYPSRVYISPAGWNPSYPPGVVLPFNPAAEFTSTNASDFLLDFIDVPTPYDSNPIVAILATDGPRLVLKSNSVHGLYGDPPALTQRVVHSGDGCIDIRSAISVPEGAFWAGNDGIYRYRYGQFTDITANWMRNEWRALTNAGIEYCAMGVDGRNLVVSIRTADAAHQTRTYLYDLELQRWLPEITNIHPRHMFTANISGEISQLLCVDDSYAGKVINLSPALDNSGPARDEVGTGPNFKVVTGDSWSQKDGIEGEVRALNLTLHNNFRDTNSIGTSTLDVKMILGGSFYGEREGQGFKYNTTLYDTSYYGPDGAKAVGTIASTPGDQVRRNDFEVNRTGRRMHVEVKETTTSSTLDTIELGEALLTVRDLREGT